MNEAELYCLSDRREAKSSHLVAFKNSKNGRWLRFTRHIYGTLIPRRKHMPGQLFLNRCPNADFFMQIIDDISPFLPPQ